MTPHAIAMLRRQRRRFEARLKKADAVLDAMQRGAALHLQRTQAGPVWTLTTGERVDDDAARLVIQSASIHCTDPGLFDGIPGQTWRWWNEPAH